MANVEVLVVGGGGQGGSDNGGGGGAGGLVYHSAKSITIGNYTVTIGNGGSGAGSNNRGNNGGNSVFGDITALGGGGGGGANARPGSNGGSGGGGCPNDGGGGSSTQGSSGGGTGYGYAGYHYMSGYGGGGGGAGTNATNGNGAVGRAYSITGSSIYYAGGGGGGGYGGSGSGGNGGGGAGHYGDDGVAGTAGTANTGGGGGGGGGKSGLGGAGGSGVVIVRYLTSDFGTCTGGTKTTDGSYTVHRFTSSGTFGAVGLPPTVTTTSITNIEKKTATSGGNVTSDGGYSVTARGVCWAITQNPTTANSKTTDGTGTGSFSSSLTGLKPGTTYYVRAYATNSAGTSYGSQVSFETKPDFGGSFLFNMI